MVMTTHTVILYYSNELLGWCSLHSLAMETTLQHIVRNLLSSLLVKFQPIKTSQGIYTTRTDPLRIITGTAKPKRPLVAWHDEYRSSEYSKKTVCI